MSGPFVAWRSLLGPLATFLGRALDWWSCWWMVTRNNPGVDLKIPHRTITAKLRATRPGTPLAASGMSALELLVLFPFLTVFVVVQWVRGLFGYKDQVP